MSQFKKIEDGVFIGPQPSAQDLDEARQQGIKTVIDLRMPAETSASNQALTQEHGLSYVGIPVDKTNLSAASVTELDAAMKANPGPFLVHCATGGRVALMLSLSEARKKGWNAEQTFDHARALGFDLTTSPEFSNFVRQTVG